MGFHERQMSFTAAQKTLERLEWPSLVAALAGECRTPGARAWLCEGDATARVFARTDAQAREWLARTTEARALVDATEEPGLGGVASELEAHLARAEKGAPLAGTQLRDVATALAVLHGARAHLAPRAAVAPALADLGDAIGSHERLARELERCIDASGDVRDEASPALREARARIARQKHDLESRIDRLLRSSSVREALSDDFVTVRNDRYVLPVRADMRGRVRGIVHDASNTGTTLFIEPEPVVEANNRLKQAELDAAHEVDRILRALSHEVALELPAVRASLEVLVEIDLAFARARLSRAQDATAPALADDGVFDLAQLRHPLIAREACVANDVRLGDAYRVLVVSGPNAGGKTVAMKALALAALCARAGLHVAAAPGARVALVDAVYADIGDEQDIRANLSTFSAHLASLAAIAKTATPRSLVVLDEIGVGTDPAEGAAIAQAVLERLADRGARVVATTHYNLLKEMASADERFCNASVAFDPQTLAPTYRLVIGSPGTSAATTVASRMGMPRDVLERAKELLAREDVELEQLLTELATSRAALEREQREAARLRAESEQVRDAYRERLERLQERRDALVRAMRDDLDRAFRDAHAQVAAVIRDLQRGGSARDAAHARERLQGLERAHARAVEERGRAAPDGEAAASHRDATTGSGTDAGGERRAGAPIAIDWARARPGDAVVVRGATLATLESLPDASGRVTVRAGSARLVLRADELRAAPAAPRARGADRIRIERAAPSGADASAARGGRAECDVRGLRVHEALERVDELVDRARSESRDGVRVVHGIGTGALRAAVREHLAACPWASDVRSPDEPGGDGVTEAELA